MPSSRKPGGMTQQMREDGALIDTSTEVARALGEGRGVVALESTLICHGIPRPRNAALALAIEDAVRGTGATPATIAVLDGRVRVGLDRAEIKRLAATTDAAKCSARDLPQAIAARRAGATTVAATIFLARRAGILVMATGGLGGAGGLGGGQPTATVAGGNGGAGGTGGTSSGGPGGPSICLAKIGTSSPELVTTPGCTLGTAGAGGTSPLPALDGLPGLSATEYPQP